MPDIARHAGLTSAEVSQYHTQGYLGPFTLCTPAEMAELRPRIKAVISPVEGEQNLPGMIQALNPAMQGCFGRHHDNPFLFDLATRSDIVARVANVMGEDLVLWRTMFFDKEPGEKMIPWHQDFDGWLIEPFLVMSAWLAIDETTGENGSVELIPGSHRQYYPLVDSPPEVMEGFPSMADPRGFEEADAVAMVLEPGQFFLFNERIVHRSGPNRTGHHRLGMAMRYIPTLVRILDPEDRGILINGEDQMDFNQLVPAPGGG